MASVKIKLDVMHGFDALYLLDEVARLLDNCGNLRDARWGRLVELYDTGDEVAGSIEVTHDEE